MARTDPKVLTPDILDRIRDLHARGYGRNAICRELGLAAGTVTKVCQEFGLSFDRTATKVAVAARKADAAQLRSELELQLLEDAQRLRAKVWKPIEYREYGGREFELRKWRQKEPAPVDQLKLMQAAGAAIDRAIRLGELDKGSEIDAARSMLTQLLQQLGVAFGEFDAEQVS